MFRVSQVALALCLSASLLSPHSNAFHHSVLPTKFQTTASPRLIPNTPAFLPTHKLTTGLFMSTTSPPLKRLGDSSIEVTITVTPSQTQAYYDKILKEVSKTLTIPGFRQGSRIPAQVLENAMAAKGGKFAIRKQAINTLVGDLLEPALQEGYGLEPIGQPGLVEDVDVLAERFEPGTEMELVVKCDIWPEVKFESEDVSTKAYFGLTGSYKRKPFDQVKMDTAMRELVERYATLDPMEGDGVLGMGDACVVNMVGYFAADDGVSKGEALPSAASGENVEVILGKGRYMEGLVEGLVGASVGDTRQVVVSFPEKLRDKNLAGRKAIFDVTVSQASHRILPEVDDEFANKVRPGLTKDALKAELRKAIDEEDAKEYVTERNEALSAALIPIIDCSVPDTIITQQAKEKYSIMMTEMRDQGLADSEIKKLISPENFIKYKDIYKSGIADDFKVSMAIDEIAKLEEMMVPTSEIDEQITQLRNEAEKEGEAFEEAAIRGRVETTMQRRMVYDLLAENSELEVIYMDEDGEEVDQELMTKLAEETLAREEEWAAKAKDQQGGAESQ